MMNIRPFHGALLVTLRSSIHSPDSGGHKMHTKPPLAFLQHAGRKILHAVVRRRRVSSWWSTHTDPTVAHHGRRRRIEGQFSANYGGFELVFGGDHGMPRLPAQWRKCKPGPEMLLFFEYSQLQLILVYSRLLQYHL